MSMLKRGRCMTDRSLGYFVLRCPLRTFDTVHLVLPLSNSQSLWHPQKRPHKPEPPQSFLYPQLAKLKLCKADLDMKRTLALCRERTALVLAKPRFLSYRSAPSPRLHPMNFSSIRAAAKTHRVEEWFWRVVFVGVVCDFLYLGWLALRLLRAK